MKKYQIILLAAIAVGFSSCKPEFDDEISNGTYTAGEADFSRYVAVGNSLTSGYMDGTMYRSGQQYSFPNLLSKQFSVVGGGEFTQPSYADDVNDLGGLLLGSNIIAKTRMIINMSTGGPQNLAGTPTIQVGQLQQKAFNNMGVPGAKSFHLLAAGYGNLQGVATGQANPYFVRMATNPNATVLADALSMNPTFFTNWIGSNDVLAYALSGGTGVNQQGNLNPATYGGNDITDPNVFAQVYSTITNGLTANGAKGVVATIPYVTSIPHFTTVPYNPLTTEALGGTQVVGQLNELIVKLKGALTYLGAGDRVQTFSTTAPNPLLIKDETLPNLSTQLATILAQDPQFAPLATVLGQIYGQARHATSNDLFVLGTSSVIGTTSTAATIAALPAQYQALFGKVGVTYPLEDMYTLIPQEQQEIKEATDSFNNTIKTIAASKGLAVADMNAIMNQLVSGIRVADGQIYTADYFKGLGNMNVVLFSLDGVHPNPRGYALVTNEIIQVINKHYKAHLPLYVPGNFPGVTIKASN
ncbi:SGNH/GDSL hydrolase family protein [Flavobacterium sp. I3-2]|uniref:SGNH/GDSL hydrolase family protein n=1 Tax=Flavobacterium sp. I3-2 TaxID=2748319 RepID=UPI0015AEA20D|nr:SGNH/GDSL hydrolase family protein [Flavobacterium sp. I3-2]